MCDTTKWLKEVCGQPVQQELKEIDRQYGHVRFGSRQGHECSAMQLEQSRS